MPCYALPTLAYSTSYICIVPRRGSYACRVKVWTVPRGSLSNGFQLPAGPVSIPRDQTIDSARPTKPPTFDRETRRTRNRRSGAEAPKGSEQTLKRTTCTVVSVVVGGRRACQYVIARKHGRKNGTQTRKPKRMANVHEEGPRNMRHLQEERVVGSVGPSSFVSAGSSAPQELALPKRWLC